MKKNTDNREYYYDAFISYRHVPLDSNIAKQLMRMLEGFRLPSSFQYLYTDVKRVFRDREELPTSSSLSDSIQEALHNSKYLFVICSKSTPQSIWVENEVMTFLSLGRQNRICVILVDGTLEDVLPKPLRELYRKDEPIPFSVIDIRKEKSTEVSKELKKVKIKVCGLIIGCNYDKLKIAYMKAVIRKRVLFSILILILNILFFSAMYSYNLSMDQEYASYDSKMYSGVEDSLNGYVEDFYSYMENTSFIDVDEYQVTSEVELPLQKLLKEQKENLILLDTKYDFNEYIKALNQSLISVYDGDLAAISGDYASALDYYNTGIKLYEELFTKAEAEYQIAEESYSVDERIYAGYMNHTARNLCYAYKKSADTCWYLQDYTKACDFYNKVLKQCTYFTNQDRFTDDMIEYLQLHAKSQVKLADCYLYERDLKKASTAANQAIIIHRLIEGKIQSTYFSNDTTDCMLQLANLFESYGYSDEADYYRTMKGD